MPAHPLAMLRPLESAGIGRIEAAIADLRTEMASMNGKIDSIQSTMRTLAGMMIGIYAGAIVGIFILALSTLTN